MSFSIVVPAFNAQRTLANAVASAVATTAERIVVVNDGSSDGTQDIAKEWARKDRRVLVETAENSGSAVARLRGLGHVSSAWVLFLDADDMVLPASVSAVAGILSDVAEDVVAIGGSSRYISANGGRMGPPTRQLFVPVDIRSVLLRRTTPWPPSSAFVRREAANMALQRVVDGSSRATYPEDYAFLVEILAFGGRVEVVPECLSLVRLSDSSKTARLTWHTFQEAHWLAAAKWRVLYEEDFPLRKPGRRAATQLRRRIMRCLVNGQWLRTVPLVVLLCLIAPDIVARRMLVRLQERFLHR